MKNKIKYIVLDVDGTMTDGKIYMSNRGEEVKAFNVKDGYGIANLIPKFGIKAIVLTGRKSKIIKNRCKELNVKYVYQKIKNKKRKLEELNINLSEVAFIGDDLNDLEAMIKIKQMGGLTGCPYNAVNEIKEKSDFISSKIGGDGAVRDFIEWVCIS